MQRTPARGRRACPPPRFALLPGCALRRGPPFLPGFPFLPDFPLLPEFPLLLRGPVALWNAPRRHAGPAARADRDVWIVVGAGTRPG